MLKILSSILSLFMEASMTNILGGIAINVKSRNYITQNYVEN